MKLEIGVIVNRKTGEEIPIYREVPEEKVKVIQETWNKKLVDFFYNFVNDQISTEKVNGKI